MRGCVIFVAAIIAVVTAQSGNTTVPAVSNYTDTTNAALQTTESPVTTHNAVVTTAAPSNHTLPGPKIGEWAVTQNKTVCILVDMAAQVELTSGMGMLMKLNLAPNATSRGVCGSAESIEWDVAVNLTMKFSFATGSDKTFSLQHISMTYKPKGTAYVNVTDVQVPLTNSFRCNSSSTVQLMGDSYNATLTLTNVMLQAYRSQATHVFGEAVPCPADKPTASNIVPIAVGAALAGLVVIVLIAYLIGRRQNRQGYESV